MTIMKAYGLGFLGGLMLSAALWRAVVMFG